MDSFPTFPPLPLPALAGGLALLGLVLYWRHTGRFAPVGHVLRLLWLPVRLVCWALWVVCGIMRPPLGRWLLWGWLGLGFFGLSTFPPLQALFPGESWLPVTFALIALLVFAEQFGTALGVLWRWEPRSRRAPPPAKPKAPPLVRIAANTGGRGEKEAHILHQLPPHLQALLRTPPLVPPVAPAPEQKPQEEPPGEESGQGQEH
jgi:hypothetical protein